MRQLLIFINAGEKLLFALILLMAVIFIQCNDSILNDNHPESNTVLSKGPGGGGHTEPQGNNLSFPVLCADGFTLTPLNTPSFAVPYTGPYTGLTTEEFALLQGYTWYAQKVTGNTWQADFAAYGNNSLYFIDWGDAMESTNPKINRPYRIELALYSQLTTTMKGYNMALLAFPSSPQETQGTNTYQYDSEWASVTTPKGKIVVQKFEPEESVTPVWDGTKWTGDGINNPLSIAFAPELNVGGKYIFGASQGGWKPTEFGDYRITFYFESGGNVTFDGTVVGNFVNGYSALSSEVTNVPIVDEYNNVSYIDVTVVQSGGGGKK